MRKIIFAVALTISGLVYSQETVVWAGRVVEVSSEFTPLEYSALQVLHKPNVLPGAGDNPNAWRPKRDDKLEFIVVEFDNAIQAKQVAIAESENPGAITRVLAYDEEFLEYELFNLTPRAIPTEKRLLNLFFPQTEYKIRALRVEVDGSKVNGFNSIDAIGISASNIPISVLIDIARGVGTNIEAEKLSENVNSQYVEHSPIISPDGKRLYFSRRYHPENIGGVDDQEDIWVSELDEITGEWLPAKNIGPPLNNSGPNFIASISVIDGEEVLILGNKYGRKGRMYTGTSLAYRKDGEFTDPISLNIENEYNYSPKADFFLSPDGKALILSAERDDTYGKRDLYVSFKKDKTSWSEPINLGGNVNTLGVEAAPFLAKDNRTLYFSSSGLTGYGGMDIYVSRRLDDSWTNWSPPENLGSGVNSEQDDQYFSIPDVGRHLYFARGQVDDDTDIFRFQAEEFIVDETSPLLASVDHLDTRPLPESIVIVIEGRILNGQTNEPITGSKVIIERLPDGLDIGQMTSKEEGAYRFPVRAGARYGLTAEFEGFIAESENVDLNNVRKADTMTIDITLRPLEVGQPIVLNNIFFEFDKSRLTTSSYPELERVLEFLKDGKIKKIEVAGHTDSVGKDEYNLALSERRARAVYQYFRNNGISADRLVVKGYGETKPVDTNSTAAGRKNNRRVEFKLLESS